MKQKRGWNFSLICQIHVKVGIIFINTVNIFHNFTFNLKWAASSIILKHKKEHSSSSGKTLLPKSIQRIHISWQHIGMKVHFSWKQLDLTCWGDASMGLCFQSTSRAHLPLMSIWEHMNFYWWEMVLQRMNHA